jgi:hypothetical protein
MVPMAGLAANSDELDKGAFSDHHDVYKAYRNARRSSVSVHMRTKEHPEPPVCPGLTGLPST